MGRLVDTPLKRGWWVIVKPIAFQRPDGRVIDMQPHFVCDYASSPRITWPLIPVRDAEYDVAAAFHDLCVRNRKLMGLSLMECHRVFDEVLFSVGAKGWRRRVMVAAVVCFNWMMTGEGDGTNPRGLKLSARDKESLEEIKAVYPWDDYF